MSFSVQRRRFRVTFVQTNTGLVCRDHMSTVATHHQVSGSTKSLTRANKAGALAETPVRKGTNLSSLCGSPSPSLGNAFYVETFGEHARHSSWILRDRVWPAAFVNDSTSVNDTDKIPGERANLRSLKIILDAIRRRSMN
jgi:hypothetical protein